MSAGFIIGKTENPSAGKTNILFNVFLPVLKGRLAELGGDLGRRIIHKLPV